MYNISIITLRQSRVIIGGNDMEKINKYQELIDAQKREREAFAKYSIDERMKKINEFNAMINRHDEARMKALQDAWKELSSKK